MTDVVVLWLIGKCGGLLGDVMAYLAMQSHFVGNAEIY